VTPYILIFRYLLYHTARRAKKRQLTDISGSWSYYTKINMNKSNWN